MSPRLARSVAAAGIVLGSLALATGCAPASPSRPDPASVVADYLDSLADGDASRASELDAAALDDADENTDNDTLRSDAVLQGAIERITGVEIEPGSKNDARADGAEARRVSFRFELDGEQFDSSLAVLWDESAAAWRLDETLARRVSVLAKVNSVELQSIGFTVPGAEVAIDDPDAAPLFYLAYPGVYEVAADLDAALLTDSAEGITRRAMVTPDQETAVDYLVTRLPALD